MKGVRPPAAGKGRPKGAVNKATKRREALIEAGGETPLEYLLSVMRNEANAEPLRLDAAKAAAPYVHPKLVTTTLKGDEDAPLVHRVDVPTKETREEWLARKRMESPAGAATGGDPGNLGR